MKEVPTDLEEFLASEYEEPLGRETEGFIVDNDDKASWALRKLAVHYRERARLIDQADAEIARIKEWKELAVGMVDQRAAYLEMELEGFFRRIRERGFDKNTYRLPAGELKRTAGRPAIEIEDEKKLLASVKAVAPDLIEVVEKVSKTALQPFIAGERLATPDGEIIEGARVREPRESYKAVPRTGEFNDRH